MQKFWPLISDLCRVVLRSGEAKTFCLNGFLGHQGRILALEPSCIAMCLRKEKQDRVELGGNEEEADPNSGWLPRERRHCRTVTQTSKPYSSNLNNPTLPPPLPLKSPHPHTLYKPIQVCCCLGLAGDWQQTYVYHRHCSSFFTFGRNTYSQPLNYHFQQLEL